MIPEEEIEAEENPWEKFSMEELTEKRKEYLAAAKKGLDEVNEIEKTIVEKEEECLAAAKKSLDKVKEIEKAIVEKGKEFTKKE